MELRLAEELLLLGLNDEKGTVESSAVMSLDSGVTGALLLELAENGIIDIAGEHLRVINPRMTGDPVKDALLLLLLEEKKPKKLQDWIGQLIKKINPVKEMLLINLVHYGILEKVDGKILWVFKTEKYPAKYDQPEQLIRKRLYDIVLGGKEPDERSMMLLTLIDACGMIEELFREKKEKKAAEKRIKELVKSNRVGEAVSGTVEGLHAALTAALSCSLICTAACYSS